MQVYAVLAGRWGRRKQDREGRAAVQLGGTNDCSSAARQGVAKEATGFPLGIPFAFSSCVPIMLFKKREATTAFFLNLWGNLKFIFATNYCYGQASSFELSNKLRGSATVPQKIFLRETKQAEWAFLGHSGPASLPPSLLQQGQQRPFQRPGLLAITFPIYHKPS